MQQELVDQHHRQQVRPGKASRDRMGGRRRLGDRLAISAGELFADMLDNLPAPRLAFQGLRDHLAELVQPLAAALTTCARRGFDDALDRQIVRQRTSRRPWILRALLLGGPWRGEFGLGFLFGLRLFEILDGKLELFDQQLAAFGGLPELFAPCLGQHQLQPLDFQSTDGHFALRQRQLFALRKDHCVRSGKVGGKRIGRRCHEGNSIIFAAKIRDRSPS
ncbi:hypothetical protein M2194_009285 [Bradyrhizobium elkanii]|nr:hypothetical protein [Bradyrhizobium elkanii]